jgi:hypothetical protein
MSNAIGFDTRHCWKVRGTKPNGAPYIWRYVPGSFGMMTLTDCEREAKKDANSINSFGGNVIAVKQHLDLNDLWEDSEKELLKIQRKKLRPS